MICSYNKAMIYEIGEDRKQIETMLNLNRVFYEIGKTVERSTFAIP